MLLFSTYFVVLAVLFIVLVIFKKGTLNFFLYVLRQLNVFCYNYSVSNIIAFPNNNLLLYSRNQIDSITELPFICSLAYC